MYRWFSLWLMMMLLVSCRQDQTSVQTESSDTATYAVFTHPTVVFFYPDKETDDSLKKKLSTRYYLYRDSLIQYNPFWRKWADSLKIPVAETELQHLIFRVGPGIETHIYIQKLSIPMGVFYFIPGNPPVLLTGHPDHSFAISAENEMERSRKRPAHQTKKIKKTQESEVSSVAPEPQGKTRIPDSLNWMRRLKAGWLSLTNRQTEFTYESSFSEPAFTGWVSDRNILQFSLENDIFTGTDIWYTNGTNILNINRIWQYSPLTLLLHPRLGTSLDHFGLSGKQNLYTPVHHTWPGIQRGDRPFSSYLTLGNFKISSYKEWRLRLFSSLDAGVIGKSALGEVFQKLIHSNDKQPIGWEYQIHDDVVLQYNFLAEKSLYYSPGHDLLVESGFRAGTLYNHFFMGLGYHYARFDDRFSEFLPAPYNSRSWGQFFSKLNISSFAGARMTNVMYDATLQGGMFNHSSPYTLSEGDIRRYVFTANAGFEMSYNGLGLGFSFHIISPEFIPQKVWHKWGRLTLTLSY